MFRNIFFFFTFLKCFLCIHTIQYIKNKLGLSSSKQNSRKYVQVIRLTSIVAKSDLSGDGTVDPVHKSGSNDSFMNQTDLILEVNSLQ